MGVISPIGNNIKDFWQALINGICGIDFIDSFDTTDFKVKIGAQVRNFDNGVLDRKEITRTDLYAQYALAASIQAMEDSKLEGKIDPLRLGVYIGSGVGGIITFSTEYEKFLKGGPRRVSPFYVPMMIANMASGMVAIRFKAHGPSLAVVSACATGNNAIGEAYRAIKHNYADAIIAGGAEAPITPIALAGFSSAMALSTKNIPLESSLPFDSRRDGFVMGEGAGVLILEEYEHAINRGADIYAEISGYGNTCDAEHITAPNMDGIYSAKAIKDALFGASGNDESSIYINAHGTGTQLNDSSETLAIKRALSKDQLHNTFISSTKSMTGHMLGAAGAAEAITSILVLREGTIPPTIGLEFPDPACDLNYTPLKSITAEIEIALSSSFGFGGHNSCLAFTKKGL